MKRRLLFSFAPVCVAVWALAQAVAPSASLARFAPPGPLLVLESPDFAALVRDWNASPEKQGWLKGANFEVFSRSRLYMRLGEASAQFADAAGLPPDMAFLDSVAGGESVLALYDIGNLEFLYITRLPSARALETALWKLRSSYETRNSAGLGYFIRMDPASRRVAAFAAAQDFLVLATREDLIAGALALIAGRPGATARQERFYAEAAKAAQSPGDLRLVLNLTSLVRSPYFRSYWIQRNASEIRQYGAGIADLHRGPAEYREDRVLLRFDQGDTADRTSPAVRTIVRLVPDAAAFYRVSAAPTAEEALSEIARKVLAAGPRYQPPALAAPGIAGTGMAGSESDLETRIDEPPVAPASPSPVPPALHALFANVKLEAMLEAGSTRDIQGDVFVRIDSAVALLSSADWDVNAVLIALRSAPDSGPLARIAVEAQGKLLVISNSAALAKQLIARSGSAPQGPPATYAAGLNHAAEHPRYMKMMRLIDGAPGRNQEQPQFFSDNIGSLSAVLARVGSETVTRRDTGPVVFETVIYRFAQ